MRILVTGKPAWFEKDSHTAISYYRMIKPLNELSRKYKDLDVYESATGTMPEVSKMDIVFLHTPNNDRALEAIFEAKENGSKVWIDFDDMIFSEDIPKANIAWTYFNRMTNKNLLKASIQAADAISVSTQVIKDRICELYKKDPEKVWVIQNAIPDEQWKTRVMFKHPQPGEVKKMMWRGSVTHEGDLMKYRNGIKPHKNLGYLFVGHLPWLLDEQYGGYLKEYNYQPWAKPVTKYFRLLKEAAPHYVFVPLENCDFNKGKSNIAWLEATLAGAACIAPDTMPEFMKVPTIRFSSPKSLDGVFKNISRGEDLRTAKYLESRAVIEKEYLLSKVNEKRLQLINSIAA